MGEQLNIPRLLRASESTVVVDTNDSRDQTEL